MEGVTTWSENDIDSLGSDGPPSPPLSKPKGAGAGSQMAAGTMEVLGDAHGSEGKITLQRMRYLSAWEAWVAVANPSSPGLMSSSESGEEWPQWPTITSGSSGNFHDGSASGSGRAGEVSSDDGPHGQSSYEVID